MNIFSMENSLHNLLNQLREPIHHIKAVNESFGEKRQSLPAETEATYYETVKNACHKALSLIDNLLENPQSEVEEKLIKAKHLYAFISQVNQKIVQVKDEVTLLRNACEIALEFGRFKMAWIGIFDVNNKTIHLVDQSGIPSEEIKYFRNAPYQSKGPQDYVLQTSSYYLSNDLEKDLELESWKSFAARHEIRSCMVLPIKKSGNIIGTFNLYSTELNFFEKEEIKLLVEVTDDISFALENFEKEKKHRETEELLAKNEKQFRHTLNKMLEEIQIIDFNWRYIYVNDALVNNSRYSREEFLGHTLMEKYPRIEQTGLFKVLNRCMNERTAEQLETEFVFPDGSKADFEISIQPIPEGIFVQSLNITEKKKAKVKLQKVNRLYAFISAINKTIVHISNEKELLDNACNIAVNIGGFKMAWIRLLDENEILQVVSFQGDETVDKKQLNFAGADSNNPVFKNLPIIKVIKTGKYDFNNDVQNDPALMLWKDEFIRHGIAATISLPIFKFGKVTGIFGLHTAIKNFFDEEEITLLEEATHDISFALENFEKAKKHRETEELVLKNEKKLQHTLDSMLEGVQIHDFDWRYIYVNDALVKYSTYSREELLGFTLMEKYPGIEQTDLFKVLNRCMNERTAEQLETEFVFPDGSKADFELNIQPIAEGIYILSVDRTEQKKAKEKLMKVNRLYSFLSSINQSIVHLSNEQELLDNACNIAKDVGKFKIARIDLLDENGMLNLVSVGGSQTVAKVAQQYTGLDYNSPELRNNLTGKVLSTGKYAVSNDVQNDPVMSPWKKELVQNGIKASISLPIIKFGKLVGVFGFHSDTENFFDEAEIALLEEATYDISFALENIEKAKKHSQTEELVLKNEKRFRALIEKSVDMKTLTDSNGMLIYGSPSVTKVLGYTNEEFLDQPAAHYFHPDDIPDLIANRTKLLQTPGQSFYFQYRFLHKEGHWLWCEGSLTNMFHEPGINAFVSNFRDISEKKLAELQREFDKNNLKALINNTPDLMWSVDRDFKLITSNESFDEMLRQTLGKSLEIGGNVLDIAFSQEQLTNYKTFYERAFAGEAFTEIEHADSPFEIWSEISFYPIRKGEEIIGTACHSHDITKRKKLEKNRLKSEKRLKEAQAIAHLGSWDLNIATGLSLWSEEHCLIYGLSPDENEQTEAIWVSFVHPDDLDYVIEITREKWITLSDSILNYRIVLNDGTIKHIYSKSKFEFDENGIPVGLHGIAHDITETKKAEQLLTKSEVFNRGVLNALSSHISVIDSKGKIVAVNEAWKYFSIENGETDLQKTSIGSNYYQVCEKSASAGDDTASEVLQGMKEVMEEKTNVFYLEYPCHSPQERRWFGLRILKFMNEEPMLVIAHQDITERKLAEEELIYKNEELQKTNTELDRFVYSASHDLRSPLTSILGLVSLIEAESKEENTLLYSDMIKTSIHRLDGFIRNILNYSRNNRTELEVEKIPLQKTVNEIVNSLRYMKEAEGINFVVEIDEKQPFYSSQQRFTTVMENIISNAIKYHKQNTTGRYIKVKGKTDKDSLNLIIEDNGIGIAAEHHNKIFNMFYRLPNKMAGSGIGLYIVKEIIEKLKGTIQVDSEEGKGTKFIVKIKNLMP